MSTVIVTEKHSVAREIAGVIGAGEKRDGYLQTKDGKRIVTWAFGHLVRYAEPNEYGAAWSGKWSLAQLPMIPDDWLLRVPGEAVKQFGIVERLMNSAERVVCATDAGREGEHIFRLIYRRAGCLAPVERLWVSSLTREALKSGLANLLPGRTFDSLAQAAEARAKADWLVGFNLTRACSVRHGTTLSVGRVQTPTLALVVRRDEQIESFRPKPYWEVAARLEPGFEAVYVRPGEPDESGKVPSERRLERQVEADAVVEKARNRPAVVADLETRRVRRRPPALFDLTALQRAANERFGWRAAKALEGAQALYEARLITYPRTESRHLPEDMRPSFEALLSSLPHPRAELALDHLRRGRGKVPGKAWIDDARLTDHHAIIPTGEAFPGSLQTDRPVTGGPASRADGTLGQLYALVASRFVQIFLTDQVVEETTVRLEIGGHAFLANGRTEVEPGWRVVAAPGPEDEGEAAGCELPALSKGQPVAVESLETTRKETTAPPRYTDATLLSAMQNAGRHVEGAEQAEVLKDTGGLGTAATRAAMIEALLKRGYLIRRNRELVSTGKGRALVAAVVDPLRSPELTATWERQLKEIEDGKGSAAGFLDAVASFVRELLPQLAATSVRVPESGKAKGKSIGSCPLCGKAVVERGKAYGCSAWRETGCPFTVWKVTNGKKLSTAQVRSLLAKGRTPPIRGFRAKSGKAFEAVLKLSGEGSVVFDFGDT